MGPRRAVSPTVTAVRPSGAGVRWSLMFGNFVVGCGVMSAAGTLNDIARSLHVSISLAGQLVAVGAVCVALGAPLLAGWLAAVDRRRLLALSLLWYGAGHALCASMTGYGALLTTRAITMLAAAVFTPQAAAAIGAMTSVSERGRAITFIFLGWSIASVLGLPLATWIGQTFGWQAAFAAIAVLSLLAGIWVYVELPDGVRPASLSSSAWTAVLTHPVLMAIVSVTALFGAAQFTLFSYLTSYYTLRLGASTEQITLLLAWFGVFGLIGNVVLSRVIDRVGANVAVMTTMGLIALSLLLWPLGTGLVSAGLVLIPWGLGCFASNSAQQARLGAAAPLRASALMALNTSAIYIGQAAGAVSGGWLIAHGGFGALSGVGLVWIAAAMALSLWAGGKKVVLR